VAEASANVAQAHAAVERAEEELANATIRAPIRGTVLTRDVEVGSPVSSILNLGANATLVMTLGDIERVFVRGKVDEADIGRGPARAAGAHHTETFPRQGLRRPRHGNLSHRRREGQRHDVPGRGLYRQPGKELKANMSANAEIILEQFRDSLLVPETAIVYDAQKHSFVDLVDPGIEDRPAPGAGQGRRRQRHADAGAERPQGR
jgi:HlyD family secretion protein